VILRLPYLTLQQLLTKRHVRPPPAMPPLQAADTLALAAPERRVLARAVRGHAQGHDETIVFFRDVTRETEVDRMKSEFLTTAAHELRTPMVSVFGFTELLLQPAGARGKAARHAGDDPPPGLAADHMVNELLDLARIEARQGSDLQREACRLDSLVRDAVARFRRRRRAPHRAGRWRPKTRCCGSTPTRPTARWPTCSATPSSTRRRAARSK
jgi:signal transduction histidine kinase